MKLKCDIQVCRYRSFAFDFNLCRCVKAAVGYVFLTWLVKTWGTDMTIFVAFSAIAALAFAFSLREVGRCTFKP